MCYNLSQKHFRLERMYHMIEEQNEAQMANLLYNIAWLRQHYGISKTRMAKLLGISVKTLNSLESGIYPVCVGSMFIIHLHKQFRYPMGSLFLERLK